MQSVAEETKEDICTEQIEAEFVEGETTKEYVSEDEVNITTPSEGGDDKQYKDCESEMCVETIEDNKNNIVTLKKISLFPMIPSISWNFKFN